MLNLLQSARRAGAPTGLVLIGLTFIGSVILTTGCGGAETDRTTGQLSEPSEPDQPQADPAGPAGDEEKAVEMLTDGPLTPTGPPLRFTALVEVAPMSPPGSKLADEDGVWLVRDDGERWLAFGLDGEEWDGRTVMVTGQVLEPEPGVQVAKLGVTYFNVDQVSEAKGDSETAHGAETDTEESPFAPTYQERETFTAVVEIDDTVGSKQFQGVWLVVEDTDERLLVAYRPSNWTGPDEDTRVKVTGRRYQNSPYVQQIVDAQHFAVDEIEVLE